LINGKAIKTNQSDLSLFQFDRRAQRVVFAKIQFPFDKKTFYIYSTQIAKAKSAEGFQKGYQDD